MFSEESTKRRSSSRAIKRPKFDDELVESSLGSQASIPFNKIRTRNPSISTASECSVSLPPTPSITTDVRKRLAAKTGKKTKKGRNHVSICKDLGRWKPTDDLALIIGVQQTCDLVAVHRGIKFSCKFTLAEIQERWYALLYDATISLVAQQAMRNLHPDQIEAVQIKALYSKPEEELLSKIESTSNPTLAVFDNLLRENPSVFYSSRTAKHLFTHWQLLKQYQLLSDQVPNTQMTNKTFMDAERQLKDLDANDTTDELLKLELAVVGRGVKKEIRKMEDQVSRWQVMVDNVTGISPPEFDTKTIAVLKGRLVRYYMRSREIVIGRQTVGNQVDIDLSLEGPAWKVSRRQAVIRLLNAEFFIANEGKRSIFVDGKPVLMGHKAKIHDNSTIEIVSLKFVFYINQGFVHILNGDENKRAPESR